MKRAGVTLVELMVALFVIALSAALAGVALLGKPSDRWLRRSNIDAQRTRAIISGTAVQMVDSTQPIPAKLLFLPDGRVLGPGFDQMTGRRTAEGGRQ
jgi:prepilin-type N-terminal cleavage/methylation domain-containing protein